MASSSSPVCVTIAASHAEASAFLTPYEERGSMKEPASPTRSRPGRPCEAAP